MADDSRMIRPCWDRPFAELTSPPWATHFWVSPKLQVCNHQMLRLPQKVALQHHQILRLPCKVTFQHHQVAMVTKRSHYDLRSKLHEASFTMAEDSRMIRPCSDHIRPWNGKTEPARSQSLLFPFPSLTNAFCMEKLNCYPKKLQVRITNAAPAIAWGNFWGGKQGNYDIHVWATLGCKRLQRKYHFHAW